ncbi:hypothetical protein AB0P21_20925 [Kribbella sp. NPDC056861]|uniref:hypothetical protein n=1 Tax=Kribbella sp. NPDC056861 TaxID=3154857 RepID=UPI003430B77B
MTSDELDPALVWQPMMVGLPAGTHLTAGGSSPLARSDDTNQLVTHATLGGPIKEEEDDSDLLKVAAGVALGVLLTIGAYKAAPHVKSWWRELRAKKATLSGAAEAADEVNSSGVATVSVAAFASEVDIAVEEQLTMMGSTEAQRRVLEILLAAAAIADNMRALSKARLEDGASAELQSALEKLTVPQVTDSLNRMLGTKGTLLDGEAQAEFMRIFGGGCAVEGQYVPLRNARVRNALRLLPTLEPQALAR